MDKMLYVAMTGAQNNTLGLRAHANNLANVSTSGFRRDFEQARSMPLFGETYPACLLYTSFNNMLAQFGIKVPPGGNVQLKNVAAVSVHAELPPFAKPGQTIDITISSIGNAKSLRGGSLLMTPLKGIDGNVYAIAQGNLVVGGFDASGADGSRITVNVPSAGRIPGRCV